MPWNFFHFFIHFFSTAGAADAEALGAAVATEVTVSTDVETVGAADAKAFVVAKASVFGSSAFAHAASK